MNDSTEIDDSDLRKNCVPSDDLPLSFWNNEKLVGDSENPTFSFTVVVNKGDIIVHAGNADSILKLLKIYDGTVQMFVLRPDFDNDRIRLEMNSDDIWARAIRNGEKILFNFFGPMPTQEFLRELSIQVNKYTQMDKMAN